MDLPRHRLLLRVHRWRRALAAALVALLAAGCAPTGEDPLAGASPTWACVVGHPARPASLPARLIPGLSIITASDPVAAIHSARPEVAGAPALNRALAAAVDREVAAYRSTVPRAETAGELDVSWDLVASSPHQVAVSVEASRTVAGQVRLSRRTVWYAVNEDRVLDSRELLTSAGWEEAVAQLTTGPCSVHPAQLDGGAGQPGLDLAFSADGSALITVPHAAEGPTTEVTVPADWVQPWLSPAGLAAQRAASAPRPLPAVVAPWPVSGAAPTPAPAETKPTETKPTLQPTRLKAKAAAGPVDCRRVRCVALTFDDGPGPHTATLVRTLTAAKAPATFFMLGQQVDAYPELTRRIARAGFEVGNHSYSHPDLTRQSASDAADQLARASSAIERATGDRPALMRPPYGARNGTVDRAAADLGLSEVLWDVDTLDWKHRNAARVTRTALKQTDRGSIVLMHDIHPTTVKAVPALIRGLRKDGYTLVTVSDLLGRTQPGSRHSRAD